MAKAEGICVIARCRQPTYLIYMDFDGNEFEICDKHWCSLTRTQLCERLGIKEHGDE